MGSRSGQRETWNSDAVTTEASSWSGSKMALQCWHKLRQDACFLYLCINQILDSGYPWREDKTASLAEGNSPKESQLWPFSSQPSWQLRECVPQSRMGSEQVFHICVVLYLHKMCSYSKEETIGLSLYLILYWFLTLSSQTQMSKKCHTICEDTLF